MGKPTPEEVKERKVPTGKGQNETLKEFNTLLTEKVALINESIEASKNFLNRQIEVQIALAAAGLALSSFSGILKGVNLVLKSFVNVSKSVITNLTMMPIVIGNFAASFSNQVRSEIIETIGTASESLKEFFDTASNGGGAVSNLGRIATGSLGAFQSVNSELTRLFGFGASGAAMMIQQLGQSINSMGVFAELFADSTTQSTKSIVFFQKMTKGLGMSAEDTKYITQEAAKNGEHYFDTMLRVKDAADSASKQFGINRKRLSMGFFDLRKDIVNFGHLSEPALMAVVARATQLGVSMESVKGVFSKFDTFESAATSAAQLQQAFGMNIDALQLIRAENPMEIVEMFRQSMLMTGRSFDDLNRHEKSLMASHTGMSAETLKSVMNYRTLGKSFEEIKKIMNDQKPEERHIRAMKDMNSSVTQVKKVIEGKGFFQNFADGVVTSIKYNSDLGKSFVKVSARMEDFYEHGLSLSRGQKKMLNDALNPLTKIVDSIIGPNGPFSKNTFKKFKTQVLKNLSEFVRDVFGDKDGKGRKDVVFAQKKWTNKLQDIFSFKKLMSDQSFIGKIFRSSGRIIGLITKGLVVAVPAVTTALGNLFNQGLANLDDVLDSDTDMGKKVMKWLGFSQVEGEEVFSGISKGLTSLKEVFIGDGENGLIARMIKNLKSVFMGAAKLIFEGMVSAKSALNPLIDYIGSNIGTKITKALFHIPGLSAAIGDEVGAGVGVTEANQEIETIGIQKALEENAKRLDKNFSQKLLNDKNDLLQNTRLFKAFEIGLTGQEAAIKEYNKMQREAHARGQYAEFQKSVEAAGGDVEGMRISKTGREAGKKLIAMMDNINHSDFKNTSAMRSRMLEVFGKEGLADIISKVTDKNIKINLTNWMKQEKQSKTLYKLDASQIFETIMSGHTKNAQEMFKRLEQIRKNEELRATSAAAERKRANDIQQSRLDELNRQAKLAETSEDERKRRGARTDYDQLRYNKDTAGFIAYGKESDHGKAMMKYGSEHRTLVDKLNHDTIRKIANLTGEKGKNAALTIEDIYALNELQGQKYDDLRLEYQNYLADRYKENNQATQIIVTMDSHVIAAHVTEAQVRQARNKALAPATKTINSPSDPSSLAR